MKNETWIELRIRSISEKDDCHPSNRHKKPMAFSMFVIQLKNECSGLTENEVEKLMISSSKKISIRPDPKKV